MSRIVLISPTPFEERLDLALGEPGGTSRRWADEYLHLHPTKVVEACADVSAGVVCLGPDLPDDVALAVAEAFDRDRPDCCVLLLAQSSPTVWEAALRAGVRDVVSPDVTDEALGRSLRNVLAVAERRRATIAQAHNRAAEVEASRVITVLSPKGGAGKTTIATNLAVGLAKLHPGRVALVDLDLQFGDVASALQLTPEQTMADVVRAPRDFDATMLKVFLAPHSSGLYALCAPETPAEADDISSAHTSNVLALLRSEFAFVIADTGAGIDEHSLAAIEASSDVLLVGSMDVASVRSLRKELEALDNLGMTAQRRHLVLNRSDSKVGMDAGDIEAVLGMAIDVAVPSSRAVPVSLNEGAPVLEAQPRTPVARSLGQLVERFSPAGPPASRSGVRLLRRAER